MKLFYSRPHALKFLKMDAKTLDRAVTKNWIRALRVGPNSKQEEFFLRSDLAEFRKNYKNGHYRPNSDSATGA